MAVKVHLHLALQKYAGGKKTVESHGKTVGECIRFLTGMFPEMEPLIFETNGQVKNYIGIYVNLQGAYPLEMEMPVKDGDEIHVNMIFIGG